MTGAALALALGLLGGAWHLGLLWSRVRGLPAGRGGHLQALIGLAGPVVATLLALRWAPGEAWAVVPGLLLARLLLLRPLAATWRRP